MLEFNWVNVLLICVILCLLIVVIALVIYNYFLAPKNSGTNNNQEVNENLRVINEYLNRLFTDYPY